MDAALRMNMLVPGQSIEYSKPPTITGTILKAIPKQGFKSSSMSFEENIDTTTFLKHTSKLWYPAEHH